MRLIDLSSTLDPHDRDLLPPAMAAAAGVVAPRVDYSHPATPDGRDRFCHFFGCSHDDLPDGEGWGSEVLNDMSSHCGTHVDAPLHSGSTCEGRTSRTIDQVELNELFCPGKVLDVRPWAQPGQAIPVDALRQALSAVGEPIRPGDAVLIRTGQERYRLGEPAFFQYPGMSREGTLFLSEQGATVLGTDAVGWDRPFAVMAQAFKDTGDKQQLWDGHKAIREKEAFIVQQLCNLGALPLRGFHVGFFPLKLARASAAPARAVAFLSN